PLYPRKRTSRACFTMSALCQKRTHVPKQKSILTRSPRRQILMTVDVQDAVLTLPVFGTLGRKRSEATDPGQLALDAKLLYRAYSFRGVQAADCQGDAAALHAVVRQGGAAGTAKVSLCDVRAHEGRRVPARPAQVFALDTRERHERLTGRPLAHPAMANARVLRRREQLIASSSALTATSPLGGVFLDYSHVGPYLGSLLSNCCATRMMSSLR